MLGLGGQGECPKKVEVYLSPAAGEISNRRSGKSTVFQFSCSVVSDSVIP